VDQSTIRTFRGANAREALAAAKAALGPEAIVIHAREVPGRLFHKPQFEVMAALDDRALEKVAREKAAKEAERTRAESAARPARDARSQREDGQDGAQGRDGRRDTRDNRDNRDEDGDEYNNREIIPSRYPRPRNEKAPREEPAWQVAAREDALQEERSGERGERGGDLGGDQAAAVRRYNTAFEAPAYGTDLQQLRSALEEAKALIGTLSARGSSPLAAAADEVHACLVGRGMDSAQASLLIKEALAQGTPLKPLALFGAIRDLLQGALVADRAPWVKRGKQAIALVGPTGVGKTTTLAKIAAKALMEQGRKVGLITVDTYRIGASEQLARYGEIMGIPAFVARGKPELVACLERLGQCDLVLVDTAGRSQNDQVKRQAELVRSVPGLELHLVVSAASGHRDLAAVAERYGSLKPERMILSKIDEAAAPAGFLSATQSLAVPVSCVCDGQRVPEDIHAVTRVDLVDLVLGSWDHDRVQ
jgi:flagellar biosynthesis protein FlhF